MYTAGLRAGIPLTTVMVDEPITVQMPGSQPPWEPQNYDNTFAGPMPLREALYKSVNIGIYVPDLICFDMVVVDAKTIEEITDHEIGKMLNYLKVTKLQVGLLINFKHPKLEFKRIVR